MLPHLCTQFRSIPTLFMLLVPNQVRQRNVLKDFVQVAGPLGVTHFIIISKTEDFINLRICRLPRGPTITFHVKAVSWEREGGREKGVGERGGAGESGREKGVGERGRGAGERGREKGVGERGGRGEWEGERSGGEGGGRGEWEGESGGLPVCHCTAMDPLSFKFVELISSCLRIFE